MITPRIAALYLVVQGVAGLLWWVLLLTSTTVRDVFLPSSTAWLAGRTLVFADVVMFGLMSVVAGWLAHRQHHLAGPAAWMALGATAYATLVAAGWLLEPVGHWVGLVAMLPSLVATGACVWVLHGSVGSLGSGVR